uniref:TSA: Wollemia nobilis Ref_Wollemi_Transcript_8261_1645 transcribed RNA sequence n=1 Tax=Wollemia nobilis TaxID=56998 RepID=A0A0C9RWM8_9CONI
MRRSHLKMAMAITAAAAASPSTALSSSYLLGRRECLKFLPRPAHSARKIRSTLKLSLVTAASSSSSSSSSSFKIKFAEGKEKGKAEIKEEAPKPKAFVIPWIVEDENGNFSFHMTHPNPQKLLEPSSPSTQKDKGKSKSAKAPPKAPTPEPKYSKAARRFFNENFRPTQRLGKVLAMAGVASRRGSEEIIFEGRVTVNGAICKTPQTRVDPLKDTIYIDGKTLPKKLPPKLYFALNKPKGYICSSGEENKSVLSLLDDYMKIWVQRNAGVPKPRLFTVGRLDVATSGLIIITNDGDFAQKVAHPSSGLTKEYIASVEGKVNRRHLQVVSEGTLVEGVRCTPVSVEHISPQPNEQKQRLRIVVHEGRNHEVRHLIENAGLKICSLKRVRIGGFKLPQDLGVGKHQVLGEAAIKNKLGLSI